MTGLLRQTKFCSGADGIGASYAFAQKAGETYEDLAIRAAQKIIATGINERAHYRGTNHVWAKNAAYIFTSDQLADLKTKKGASDALIAAVELIENYRTQSELDQHYGREGDARHRLMHELAKRVPAVN